MILPWHVKCAEDLYTPCTTHPVETIANLDKVPIVECGEPLVPLRTFCPELAFAGHQEYWLREGTARRLSLAHGALMETSDGCKIRIGEAYRSRSRQKKLFNIAYGIVTVLRPWWPRHIRVEAAAKFVASPFSSTPPPHSTGGSVDISLVSANGKPLDMGPWRSGAQRLDYDRLSEPAKRSRRLLANAMQFAGFSNYGEEWWHWSFGDSGWAIRTGAPHAIYGETAPPGDRSS